MVYSKDFAAGASSARKKLQKYLRINGINVQGNYPPSDEDFLKAIYEFTKTVYIGDELENELYQMISVVWDLQSLFEHELERYENHPSSEQKSVIVDLIEHARVEIQKVEKWIGKDRSHEMVYEKLSREDRDWDLDIIASQLDEVLDPLN